MVWCCDNLCREACAKKRRKAEHAARIAGDACGLITPVQTAVNTRLGRPIGSPLCALAGVVQRRPHCDADFDAAAWPVSADSRHRGERSMVDVVRGRVRCHFPDRQCAAAAETGQSQNRDHASHRADRHGPADRRFRLVRHYRAADFPLRIAGAAITLVGFLLAVAGPNLRLRPAIDRPVERFGKFRRFRKIRN